MNPGGWAPECALLTPTLSCFRGEGWGWGGRRGHTWDWAGVCAHQIRILRALGHTPGVEDRKEGRIAGLEKKRWGKVLWPQPPPPWGGRCPGEACLSPWLGDTRAGQWQPSPTQGNRRTGPYPGSKCRADQLKQADKGRTIPDLKNAQNDLPRGGSSGLLWERQCPGAGPDNPLGCCSPVQRHQEGRAARPWGRARAAGAGPEPVATLVRLTARPDGRR